MKKLTSTKKTLVICIALNVLIFSAYGFLFWNIKAKNDRINFLFAEVDADLRKDESLRSIKYLLEENQEFLPDLDALFVSADGVVSFITDLENLADESGVDLVIGSVDIEDNPNNDDFKDTLLVSLETSGSWSNTFYFLSILENLPYKIIFNQAAFGLAGASESILFKNSPEEGRSRGENEFWRGSFDLKVIKLR